MATLLIIWQVMVVVDARPNLKVSSISHKQFVEHVGAKHVANREAIEGVAQARTFSFEAESTSVEQVVFHLHVFWCRQSASTIFRLRRRYAEP